MGTAKTEFSDTRFYRINSLNDFLENNEINKKTIINIILEETLTLELAEYYNEVCSKAPNAMLAFAYRDNSLPYNVLLDPEYFMASSDISFLPMNVSLDIWLCIIRLMLCGHKYLPCDLLSEIVKNRRKNKYSFARTHQTDEHTIQLSDLTVREQEVLQLLAEGKPNKTIATEFDISEHTVKLHIHHIIVKLDVHNRTEAAIWYLSQNKIQISKLQK